ncbi:molybdopterin-dependent oxidoreductase [Taklimakanibacter lacteus]|uniref:molybdopterin-dependent oxidoreductase n=1 Tax=Taklimakanibacter lacteus TaxID=2268456 RepID=UPI000E666EB6
MSAQGPVKTTCPYCGVGCGIIATQKEDGGVAIAGDPDHPANFGRLCSKGSALGETLSLAGRQLHPLIDGRRAPWPEALGLVARKFTETIDAHGPDSVAFYVSGQLLTEDYYVANKLMKGFIGSANIDTNSRLCMASAVAGHVRAFGSDTVPGAYEDFELADLVVLVGSNLAWCHPVLFQRLMAAREKRGIKLVVIDPRRTATAEAADLHLAIEPGGDVALFNGLLLHLFAHGKADAGFVANHTAGLDAALAACGCPGELAERTGSSTAEIESFFTLFADHDRTVTGFSQGVNQSSSGTDKVNAIINCHLITGRIGRPGTGPFSLTGQPNAMGGREVGGLANALAAHMDINDPCHRARVGKFWSSPCIAARPGRKAVDMFRAVRDGQIKALWIMATNPAVSMPASDLIAEALAACPFVVVSDVTAQTDTARHAHVFLPAAAWGEKSGTVTNSERRISRQRNFLPIPGEAQPDWRIIADVAQQMGYGGFDFASPAAIFREHAALTGLANNGTRDLDLSACASLSDESYEELAPFQWGRARYFGDGRFYTQDKRARFVPTPWRDPAARTTPARPYILNTGRIRDQWHTMTRTAKAPRLLQHIAEPFCELHPDDAEKLGLAPASLVEVASGETRIIACVLLNHRQRRGTVFVPMHWTREFSGNAVVNRLVAANTDPVSGQPELKWSAVALQPVSTAWYGFAVSRDKPRCGGLDYWSLAPADKGYRLECAGLQEPEDFPALLAGIFPSRGEMLAYHDQAAGEHRFALFEGDRLVAAMFFARQPVGVSRSWLAAQLGDAPSGSNRLRLLAGRGGADGPDHGAIICACFAVGIGQIAVLIASREAATVTDVGRLLRAGTNCGSCKPEIARIIHEATGASAVPSGEPHRSAQGSAGLL